MLHTVFPYYQEVATQTEQVKILSDNPIDYWKIYDKREYVFSTVWNGIRLATDSDDNFKLIWHNKTAKKFLSLHTWLIDSVYL